ncbi:response regulator transcription factor [Rubellimicrobium rubrum]|uniref:Response regulator transcription factor n=1 Tax=Rubellimicrobium rubrum TaxID=2585369 RepID=A0A5C4MU39_9RHOB|nr:response regulator transcription factor [Rubellimicrobium rubrum]TNC47297.1 response regulator transcription factor [Rubellimicrobium rubrum]
MRALIVEDEEELARFLARLLAKMGVISDIAQTRGEATELAELASYDIVVLDRRLPDGDGLRAIPDLRRHGADMPILMLTALDDIESRIEGLDAGADDYLPKPFDSGELTARVRALLRRPGLEPDLPISVGRVVLNARDRTVEVRGVPLTLAVRELNLLEALVRRANRVVTRESLVEAVYEAGADVFPNALDANVSRLRARLRELDAEVELTAVRGVGYMLTGAT